MNRTLFGALFALVASALQPAQAQPMSMTADAIVSRHIEARGGAAAMRAIRSLVFDDGAYGENGQVATTHAVMSLMRPYYKLVGDPERHPDFMEGYNGEAWEYFADPGIVLHTVGAASEASRHYADVDGPFLDYAERGSHVELIGVALIGQRRTYDVRLTMMDGYATDHFIDARTFMVIASHHSAEVHAFGSRVTSETRFEDFRRVAGVMFPFRSKEVEIATGHELNSMQWGRIDANVDIPVAWFSPPVYEHSPIQSFIEQLYDERTDVNAMLWTYRVFRRAHPGVSTDEASAVAGYQALKMGQVEQAIALLERNATDNPRSADAAFGLGRAYASENRNADARHEFQRALTLKPGHARATRALAALPSP